MHPKLVNYNVNMSISVAFPGDANSKMRPLFAMRALRWAKNVPSSVELEVWLHTLPPSSDDSLMRKKLFRCQKETCLPLNASKPL